MAKYNLQPDEAVVLTADNVQHGDGLISGYTDELVLTNLHLIWISKGMLGNVKRIEYYPLALVKVYNDQAQALLGKTGNGTPTLQVFFQQGQEIFKFQSGAKEINKWIDSINQVVTGHGAAAVTTATRAIPGAEAVAETLRDTFSQFKGVFGGSKGGAAPPPAVRSSIKCPGCTAPLSGVSGTAVTCQYCDSVTPLP